MTAKKTIGNDLKEEGRSANFTKLSPLLKDTLKKNAESQAKKDFERLSEKPNPQYVIIK